MAQSNTESRVESGRSKDRETESARETHAARSRDPEKGLHVGDSDQLWQRWWQIQASFVDAPRSAVAEAHAMLSGIVDGLVRQLGEQRAELERRWASGQEISTEELRRDLQSYRDFLGDLLSRWEGGAQRSAQPD